MIRRGLQQKEILKIEAINDEHAEKQQMAPLAEGEEEGEGVNIQLMIFFAFNLEGAN